MSQIEDDEDEEATEPEQRGDEEETTRDTELSGRADLREDLLDLYKDIEKGFDQQRDRSDDILDYWDAYHCVLGPKQFYVGNAQMYVPIVRNALDARQTRFVNQLFPQSGRIIDCVTMDGDIPHELISLLQHYVEDGIQLSTDILPALFVEGDVSGQWTVYVGWEEHKRHITYRDQEPLRAMGLEHPELGEVEVRRNETLTDSGPTVEIIPDQDFLVLPTTAKTIDDAVRTGGSVTILRRWSKAKIRQMIRDEEIVSGDGEELLEVMQQNEATGSKNDVLKAMGEAAGVKLGDAGKFALVYETWSMQEVDDEHRLVRTYFGGDKRILGCKLCPFWCDRVPVISAPVTKTKGVFKGMSLVKPGVLDHQIEANDAMNQGADNLSYALNPVTTVDPQEVARWDSLVLDLGAIWPVKPDAAKVLEFPNISQQALAVVSSCAQTIFQSLSVNPSMMPQQTGGKNKRNQAEIAMEQQVDLLTTAQVVTRMEKGILNPLLQRLADYDHQFREDDLIVPRFGEMGVRLAMETIPPQQSAHRLKLRWNGVEAARNAAANQQKTAFINVLRGIPANLYPNHQLNIEPILVQQTEDLFGPRMAPLIFQDKRAQLTVDPEIENDLLSQGMPVTVHMADDDPKHLEAHQQVLAAGDPTGFVRLHIQMHQAQLQAKQQMAAQQQQQQQGAQGVPGGAGPGVAGTPRPGGQPGQPISRGPPGQIHPDSMGAAGAVVPPRST